MMLPAEDESSLGIFKPIIGPWYKSLENPQQAQIETLSGLLREYKKTSYGKSHGASENPEIESYRKSFPSLDYQGLQPLLAEIRKGNYGAILPEPLACWVMTRGSTGTAKVLPSTKAHLEQIFACGAR